MSQISNLDSAVIDERKLTEYLLATGHPLGKAKAKVFQGLGFRRASVETLRTALLRHARENPISWTEETPFGSKYIVDGPLEAPSGRTAAVRAVWFIESGEQSPRFVTAYPIRGGIE